MYRPPRPSKPDDKDDNYLKDIGFEEWSKSLENIFKETYNTADINKLVSGLIYPTETSTGWVSTRNKITNFLKDSFIRNPHISKANTNFIFKKEEDAMPWIILSRSGLDNYPKVIGRMINRGVMVEPIIVFENQTNLLTRPPFVVTDVKEIVLQLYWIFYVAKMSGIFIETPKIYLKRVKDKIKCKMDLLTLTYEIKNFIWLSPDSPIYFCKNVPNFVYHKMVRDILRDQLSITANNVYINDIWTLEETIFRLSATEYSLSKIIPVISPANLDIRSILPGKFYYHNVDKKIILVVAVDIWSETIIAVRSEIKTNLEPASVTDRFLVPLEVINQLQCLG